MKPILIYTLLLLTLISGCLKREIHQGNVLEPEKVLQIREGDTRYRVEALIGTPVARNVLYPQRASYIEDYVNPNKGERYRRGITIEYDRSGRVESLHRYGFSTERE
ncbi:MAG: outer membrane protein assembly factor BamE [Mariprofundaceae bacterium]